MTDPTGAPKPSALRFPDAGAVRVHPDPGALPRLRHEGPGRNRFDDPHGAFVVRYAANTLRGCLIETLSRFRPHPDQYGRRWDGDDGATRSPRDPKGTDLPRIGPWQHRR